MAKPPFEDNGWWDEKGFLYGLNTLLGPVREPYVLDSLKMAGLRAQSAVLDLGSGGGFISAALSKAGHQVTGVDPSLHALRDAAQNVKARFAAAVGEALPFADAQFDAVVASEVLEHVGDPKTVIAEIGRVLRPGGSFVFSLPNRTWLSRLVLIDLAQRFPPTRVLPAEFHDWDRFIKPGELRKMATENGLVMGEARGLTIRLRDLPHAAGSLLALRRGRISYAEAGRRIDLTLATNLAVAYLGTATRI